MHVQKLWFLEKKLGKHCRKILRTFCSVQMIITCAGKTNTTLTHTRMIDAQGTFDLRGGPRLKIAALTCPIPPPSVSRNSRVVWWNRSCSTRYRPALKYRRGLRRSSILGRGRSATRMRRCWLGWGTGCGRNYDRRPHQVGYARRIPRFDSDLKR